VFVWLQLYLGIVLTLGCIVCPPNTVYVTTLPCHRCVCLVAAVPRYCANCGGGRDRCLLVLPGGQEFQDHGVLQEHGAAVCAGHPRKQQIKCSGRGAGGRRHGRGEVW